MFSIKTRKSPRPNTPAENSFAFQVEELESRMMLSTFQVIAAGVTNQEQMQLQIDGSTVQTWNNVGGDAYADQFQTYTFNNSGTIAANRVRIRFTNDAIDPVTGADRNLRIDAVVIDGTRYETEGPDVYSTGTYRAADGVVPGYRTSEYLHTGGYFQYDARNTGSTIVVRASGETGQENMQLQIDGVAVQNWNNLSTSAQNYTYNAGTDVTADRVRVAFTNDFFDAATNQDRNLTVDRITIDGTTYQTEAPTVYSTGTYRPNVGIVPGFVQSEVLHSGGYFQYDAAPTNNGSSISFRAAGATGQETIELQIDGTTVRTYTNVGGNFDSGSFQTFNYQAAQNIAASRVRLAFTNDFYVDGGEDRNVRIDSLTVDGAIYQTEAPNVYSTGTWKPADGITPGFRQSEILHTNGYFQYDATGFNAGVISLASSIVNVGEGVGNAVVTIRRTDGSSGRITVDYRTIDGTAIAGQDYTSRSGTIAFEDGVTQRTVSIPITNDSFGENNETFNFAIDNVTGGGSLLVPRTATITISDNDVSLPNYSNFNNTSNLTLNGAAQKTGSVIRLAPVLQNASGSVYFNDPVTINASTSFKTRFRVRMHGGNGSNGADGMAFVIQNSSQGRAALGGTGELLGYSGVTNSLAVEFDTFANAGDINNNHVSVLLNGNTANAVATRTAPLQLNNGSSFNAWVEYNGIRNELAVYVGRGTTRPARPLIVTYLDLAAVVGNQAYLGFSAGTGGFQNNHDLENWSYNTDVPPPAQPPVSANNLVSTTVASGYVKPTAIDWTDNGRNLLVAEQRGIVQVVRDGVKLSTPFIDISSQVNHVSDRGLLDVAVHPNFPSQPYVYLLFTYDPPEVYQNQSHSLAGPDKKGNRAGRLIRVTADASTDYATAVADSEVVLLGTNSTWQNFNGFVNSTFNFTEPAGGVNSNGTNVQDFIASDSESHSIGDLAFGPEGALYVTIGDGASYNRVDPRAVRVQDIDNLSGKVLRINPINGRGLTDNPFYNGNVNANRSKVYQLGLRNPFRMTIDQSSGQVYVGDVGWGRWEEVNAGGPGANYGWPFYEGGNGNNIRTPGYQDLPEAAAFYSSGTQVTASIYGLNHAADGINAIVMGDLYTGDVYPAEYQGDLFVNDLGQGIVRNISFDSAGNITSIQTFTTGANIVVQIKQGPDGTLYFVDLDNGFIGRWVFD